MKKVYYFVVCCLAVILLTVCNGKSVIGTDGKNEEESAIIVKGADGTEYDSYQKACRDEDFDAAHQFLDILKERSYYKYKEAREEVFRLEALFLSSQENQQSNKRILYLLKEDEEDVFVMKKRCKMLIDISQSTNNNDLFFSVIKLFPETIEEDNIDEYMTLLAGNPDKAFSNIIFNILLEKKKKILRLYYPMHDGEIMKTKAAPKKGFTNNKENHEGAIRQATECNDLCDMALNIAIDEKNSYLANKILSLYIPVPCPWHEGKRAYYQNNSKNKAQERIRKAKLN